MSVKLLAEHLLEVLSLKGGSTCSSESTLVKMPHCWKSHVTALFICFTGFGKKERTMTHCLQIVEPRCLIRCTNWLLTIKMLSIRVRFIDIVVSCMLNHSLKNCEYCIVLILTQLHLRYS